MALVYPQHAGFAQPLSAFDFSAELQLWVLPFDLERGLLVMPEHWRPNGNVSPQVSPPAAHSGELSSWVPLTI